MGETMQINGGRVAYSRTVNPAPYESAKADVELSFLLEDGDSIDDCLIDCLDICKDHVHAVVGIKKGDK